MNYQLEKGPDGTIWVSVQPLMQDVNHSMKHLMSIDTSTLSDTDKDIMDFNIIGMKAIYTFLGALVQEVKVKEELQKQKEDKCED